MPNDLHTRPKKNNEKRNFYIALSVCLLAAAAAAFSTYISVMDHVQTNRAVLAGESAADIPAETVSGFETYINSAALASMGITVPADVAEKAIEAE